MTRLETTVRVRAEGLGIAVKSVTTFIILLYDSRSNQGTLALVAFALGQMFYSLALVLAYLLHFGPTALSPKFASSR